MSINKWRYATEKFSTARSILLIPQDEEQALFHAFSNCRHGLEHIDSDAIDEPIIIDKIRVLRETMDTTGIEDPTGRGAGRIRAERLTREQRVEFSEALDFVATWLQIQAHRVSS